MSMVLQQKKSGKLMWTQSWRRLNKKGKDEGVAKKKTRKTVRVQRAIGSFTKEEIKAKKDAVVFKPKDAATEAALKEIKERQKVRAELMWHHPASLSLSPILSLRRPNLTLFSSCEFSFYFFLATTPGLQEGGECGGRGQQGHG